MSDTPTFHVVRVSDDEIKDMLRGEGGIMYPDTQGFTSPRHLLIRLGDHLDDRATALAACQAKNERLREAMNDALDAIREARCVVDDMGLVQADALLARALADTEDA